MSENLHIYSDPILVQHVSNIYMYTFYHTQDISRIKKHFDILPSSVTDPMRIGSYCIGYLFVQIHVQEYYFGAVAYILYAIDFVSSRQHLCT